MNHLGEPKNAFTVIQGYDCDKSYVDIELLNNIISSDNDELSNIGISEVASGIN